PRNPSRSKKRLLKTALRDNYLEKRRMHHWSRAISPFSVVVMPFMFYFPESACSTSNTSGSGSLSGALLLLLFLFIIL
ncbi:hypothetical protein, partial [Aeromonas veronii]|uniref:hypothetical protein n=1 Tax=Aeromonas veronii TaxID=654 RepID=UPI001FD18491